MIELNYLSLIAVSFHVSSLHAIDVLLTPAAVKYFLHVSEQSEVQDVVHHDHLTSDRFSFWRSARNIARVIEVLLTEGLECIVLLYCVSMQTAGKEECYRLTYGEETN